MRPYGEVLLASVAKATGPVAAAAECDTLRAAYKSGACKGDVSDKLVLVDGSTSTCGVLKERFHAGGCPCPQAE